jgi:type II restriction/modification system DNA methylase subunit YeeA
MTPAQFITKWRSSTLKERSAAQEHFIDLCRLLGEPTPAEADPHGAWYCFERGAAKTGGGEGWADVWRKGAFAWEYKGKHKDLSAALKQLQLYALALENPPLLVVSDMETIVIHTAFTNTVPEVHVIPLEDLGRPDNLQKLKWLFAEPERLRPGQTTDWVTKQAAEEFAELAEALRGRGHDPHQAAHFLNKCLFCLFAEDAGLLPNRLFTRLLEAGEKHPEQATPMLQALFAAMSKGGLFGADLIDWFNGGLFDGADALPLERTEIRQLLKAARLDWSAIEPSIFGTLFERGLDPDKRSQLGAHYTDPGSIRRLIEPVVVEPLMAEWEETKASIQAHLEKSASRKDRGAATKDRQTAERLFQGFLERLSRIRVLDPACGSGNFLYLALQALKDLEHRAMLEAEALGLQRHFPAVGPECVLGIELNPYAAELARVTVWIGEIQWMLKHGFGLNRNPILRPLQTIQCRDAVLDSDGSEAAWPEVDCIVGNPPFLGGSKKRGALGDAYFEALNRVYDERVPGGADLVCYWFEKARAQIEQGKAMRVGLVATNSIRGGANRKVLERILWTKIGHDHGATDDDDYIRYAQIHSQTGNVGLHAGAGGGGRGGVQGSPSRPKAGDPGISGLPAESGIGELESGPHQMDDGGVDRSGRGHCHSGQAAVTLSIFNAWSDEPWVNEGAAVRVSLVCFGAVGANGHSPLPTHLNGQPVAEIYADLTARPLESSGAFDLTRARPLAENAGCCFMGASKKAPFDIPGDLARAWLKLPNPHGRPNSDVLRPLWNGLDLTRRPRDVWIIDFGTDMPEAKAALYEAPFAYVVEHVKPEREKNNREAYRKYWWRHAEARPGLRTALAGLPRYIATPEVAKHRIFVWMHPAILPDQKLYAIARPDDATFGLLQTRIHELWALRMCTWHGVGNDPRYTPTTCFETFPFPEGVLTDPAPDTRFPAIAQAARRLNELRENWLNPPEWVERVPEIVPGYPDRLLPKPGIVGANGRSPLQTRTLTNLYNQRPAWLANAHRALDEAVAAAYGWMDYTPDMPDEEILRRLLALNFERAGDSVVQ